MTAQLLADLVTLLHFTFILFVLFGALLLFRWRRVALLHIPAVIWAAQIEFMSGICPLTPLENRLRRAAGKDGYQGSFIEHYLEPVIYPAGLTQDISVLLGLGVIVINVALYVWLIVKHYR